VATLGAPDWVVLDLDPGDATTWPDVIEVALAVRRLLDLLELPSVPKTSGQRGLHVLVPLAPGHRTAEAIELARGVASMIARLLPAKVTLELDVARRGGRLFLDHAQHDAKLLVLPYALRAVDGAPASTPLRWDEVTPALEPRALGLRTLRARLDAHGDLAAPLLAGTGRLAPALARLAQAG
jgi:bifunctional non-homologous end joining protein LigD